MIQMNAVTPEYAEKLLRKAKDHQEVEFSYMAATAPNKNFKMYMEDHGVTGWDIVKISRVHAVTNCKYSELQVVKDMEAARQAKIDAGEEVKEKRPAPERNTIVPNCLDEANGTYYFYTYPTEGFSIDPYIAYCIIDAEGNIQAEYDSNDEEAMNIVKDFIQPSYFKRNEKKVDTETGEIKFDPRRTWRLDRMYEFYLQ